MNSAIEIRELSGAREYAACIELQKATWGQDFTELVPAALLQVTQKVGGIAAGAFEHGELVGFVYGITGVQDGRLVHWSDMLAVRATHRNRGIGDALKRYQRETMLTRGVDRILWTFDPLVAKNAHINFSRLGIYAREYVVDMYGQTDSPLHAGIGTDRLIAVWDLTSERVVARLEGRALPDAADLLIEVPLDIHALNERDPKRAREWREQSRAQFLKYLPGYVVTGFSKNDDVGRYALTSASNFAL